MLPGQVFQHAASFYETHTASEDRGAEWCVRQFWGRTDVPFFIPLAVASGPVQRVDVNHARWVVHCPFCLSAQLACRTDHRFFCVACLNEEAGAKWLPVEWPADPAAIEDALRPRPTKNCNWLPGETLEDLVAENVEHGVI